VLADALGDTPETVIPVYLLRHGLCDAYVAGDPADCHAAIVQPLSLMEEPFGFGENADAIWERLSCARGWKHINVALSLAAPLAAVMERETGAGVRWYGDVHHTLTRPAATFHDPAVRELTPEDLPILRAASAVVDGDPDRMLREGIAVGAIVAGALVGIAHTSAITDAYADIGVLTLQPWQGRGFATAAASIVAATIQSSGRIPVWSAGEDNFASLRVTRKVGFVETSLRVYLSTDPRV
jgi:hypothetical protein